MQSRLGEKKNNYLRRWSRAVELAMTVAVLGGAAVAMTVRPSDSSGTSNSEALHCAETPVGVSFPAGLSLLFFFSLLPVCLSQFPSRYSPVFFLCFSVSFVSLSTQLVSISRFPSPFSALFSFLLASPFPLLRVTIYRGRGSGVDPAPSHRCPCMGRTSPALPRRWQRWPMEASLAGYGCSGISSWDGWRLTSALRHVGGRDKQNFSSPAARPEEEEEETVPPQNDTVSFFFFFFFLKAAWNGVVLLKTRRFI